MSICVPCRDEGKGGIVAHYEADPRRNRPAMCYDHYWQNKKSDGFIPATNQPKPVVEQVRGQPSGWPFAFTVDAQRRADARAESALRDEPLPCAPSSSPLPHRSRKPTLQP